MVLISRWTWRRSAVYEEWYTKKYLEYYEPYGSGTLSYDPLKLQAEIGCVWSTSKWEDSFSDRIVWIPRWMCDERYSLKWDLENSMESHF